MTCSGTDGWHGGFGGGGGAAGHEGSGGKGDFGGGGGAGPGGLVFGGPGEGGSFAGDASDEYGGGGAGLGGAIFSHGGSVTIENSTFTANFAVRGLEGGEGAGRGQDAGGAIFSVAGALVIHNSTIAGNESTGEGAGVAVYRPTSDVVTTFALQNTIIANNIPSTRECFLRRSVTSSGIGNLIVGNATDADPIFACPGVVTSDDPQLGFLQLNAPGLTPTMAIGPGSPAIDAGDLATCLDTDQTGTLRPIGDSCDIGAYEYGNRAPVAKCKSVSVSAGTNCTATASIDDGTYDPEGDSFSLAQAPPGPYALGSMEVTLTATDSHGAASNCTATVTVVDDMPPVITSSIATPLLSPTLNHALVNVGLTAAATDNCSAPGTLGVQVFGDEDDQTPTNALGTIFSPDAAKIAVGTLALRAERVDSGDGRVYLVVMHASDASGNGAFACSTVVVPKNASAGSLALVNSQAATAKAYCGANGGGAPVGYLVIGDGPVIGPKQ